MILDALEVYHTPNFEKDMVGAEMLLWTIIDGEIYLQQNPYNTLHTHGND